MLAGSRGCGAMKCYLFLARGAWFKAGKWEVNCDYSLLASSTLDCNLRFEHGGHWFQSGAPRNGPTYTEKDGTDARQIW